MNNRRIPPVKTHGNPKLDSVIDAYLKAKKVEVGIFEWTLMRVQESGKIYTNEMLPLFAEEIFCEPIPSASLDEGYQRRAIEALGFDWEKHDNTIRFRVAKRTRAFIGAHGEWINRFDSLLDVLEWIVENHKGEK